MNIRKPGRTNLIALLNLAKGDNERPHSKGCGAVTRAAPFGLFYPDNYCEAYRRAGEGAACTHYHKTAQESAGALAGIISLVVDGKSVRQAVRQVLSMTKNIEYSDHETDSALRLALQLIDEKTPPQEAFEKIGKGWIAENVLAGAVYCSLKAKDFRSGVLMAVNHGGDSVGAVCGNILGTLHGVGAIPKGWLEHVELREFIERLTYIFHRVTYIKAIGQLDFYERKAEFADIFIKNTSEEPQTPERRSLDG